MKELPVHRRSRKPRSFSRRCLHTCWCWPHFFTNKATFYRMLLPRGPYRRSGLEWCVCWLSRLLVSLSLTCCISPQWSSRRASSRPAWWTRPALTLCLLVLRWGPLPSYLKQPRLLFKLVLFPPCQPLEIGHRHPKHPAELVRWKVSLGEHVEADQRWTLHGYLILIRINKN